MMKRILLACISLFFLGCGNFLDINPESEVVNDDMFSTADCFYPLEYEGQYLLPFEN